MICFDKITDLFCITDEFCKNFEKTTAAFLIGNKPKRKPRMSTAEVITIYYLFHLSGFRCFKHFYIFYVQPKLCIRNLLQTKTTSKISTYSFLKS